jgi:hypothetical protein
MTQCHDTCAKYFLPRPYPPLKIVWRSPYPRKLSMLSKFVGEFVYLFTWNTFSHTSFSLLCGFVFGMSSSTSSSSSSSSSHTSTTTTHGATTPIQQQQQAGEPNTPPGIFMTFKTFCRAVDQGTIEITTRATMYSGSPHDFDGPVPSPTIPSAVAPSLPAISIIHHQPSRPLPSILKRKLPEQPPREMYMSVPNRPPVFVPYQTSVPIPSGPTPPSLVRIPPPCPSAPKRNRVRALSPFRLSSPCASPVLYTQPPSPAMTPTSLRLLSEDEDFASFVLTPPDSPRVETPPPASPSFFPTPAEQEANRLLFSLPSPHHQNRPPSPTPLPPRESETLEKEEDLVMMSDVASAAEKEEEVPTSPDVQTLGGSPPWITRARDAKKGGSAACVVCCTCLARLTSCYSTAFESVSWRLRSEYVRCGNTSCEAVICYDCYRKRAYNWYVKSSPYWAYQSLDFQSCHNCRSGLSLNCLPRLLTENWGLRITILEADERLKTYLVNEKTNLPFSCTNDTDHQP